MMRLAEIAAAIPARPAGLGPSGSPMLASSGAGVMIRCTGVYIWRLRGAWRGRWRPGATRTAPLAGRARGDRAGGTGP
jgi:hypothetical protein